MSLRGRLHTSRKSSAPTYRAGTRAIPTAPAFSLKRLPPQKKKKRKGRPRTAAEPAPSEGTMIRSELHIQPQPVRPADAVEEPGVVPPDAAAGVEARLLVEDVVHDQLEIHRREP